MRALLLLCIPALAAAQPAPPTAPGPTPAQALAKIEATYAKATAITGDFSQSVLNATFGTTTPSGGTFALAKPDKLRFDYVNKKKKPDKTFLFDGTTFWYVDLLNRRATKSTASASAIPAALAFLTNPAQLAKDFTIAAPANQSQLVAGSVVLELTPKQPSASYAKIQLVVDPATWTVPRSIVYAPSGDTTTYALSNLDLAAKVAPDRFTFTPPKSYAVTTAPAEPATPATKAPATPPKRP